MDITETCNTVKLKARDARQAEQDLIRDVWRHVRHSNAFTQRTIWEWLSDKPDEYAFCRPLWHGEYDQAPLGAKERAYIVGKKCFVAAGDEDEYGRAAHHVISVYVVRAARWGSLLQCALNGEHLAEMLLSLIEEKTLHPCYDDEFGVSEKGDILHGYRYSQELVVDLLALPKFMSEGAKS